uniref:Uncharacterized protein n=1 Tax=Acrobeloides nanus TaxID=290746 RepID=A0A914D9Y7_9BILA
MKFITLLLVLSLLVLCAIAVDDQKEDQLLIVQDDLKQGDLKKPVIEENGEKKDKKGDKKHRKPKTKKGRHGKKGKKGKKHGKKGKKGRKGSTTANPLTFI